MLGWHGVPSKSKRYDCDEKHQQRTQVPRRRSSWFRESKTLQYQAGFVFLQIDVLCSALILTQRDGDANWRKLLGVRVRTTISLQPASRPAEPAEEKEKEKPTHLDLAGETWRLTVSAAGRAPVTTSLANAQCCVAAARHSHEPSGRGDGNGMEQRNSIGGRCEAGSLVQLCVPSDRDRDRACVHLSLCLHHVWLCRSGEVSSVRAGYHPVPCFLWALDARFGYPRIYCSNFCFYLIIIV